MVSSTQSTADTLVNPSPHPHSSPATDQSPGFYPTRHIDDAEKILAIDLRKHYGDADKLYGIAKDFQQLGHELQAEVIRLNTKANLTKSQSKGSSRRDTDDSDYSLKKGLKDTSIGIAITYDPSDHRITVRSMEAMKGRKYTITSLPPFHWWTDTLHIYSVNNPDPKEPGSEFKVFEKKLPEKNPDYNFMRTIKLGQLGCGVIRRRRNGTLNVIYVLSPESQPGRSTEMRMYAEPAAIL